MPFFVPFCIRSRSQKNVNAARGLVADRAVRISANTRTTLNAILSKYSMTADQFILLAVMSCDAIADLVGMYRGKAIDEKYFTKAIAGKRGVKDELEISDDSGSLRDESTAPSIESEGLNPSEVK